MNRPPPFLFIFFHPHAYFPFSLFLSLSFLYFELPSSVDAPSLSLLFFAHFPRFFNSPDIPPVHECVFPDRSHVNFRRPMTRRSLGPQTYSDAGMGHVRRNFLRILAFRKWKGFGRFCGGEYFLYHNTIVISNLELSFCEEFGKGLINNCIVRFVERMKNFDN